MSHPNHLLKPVQNITGIQNYDKEVPGPHRLGKEEVDSTPPRGDGNKCIRAKVDTEFVSVRYKETCSMI